MMLDDALGTFLLFLKFGFFLKQPVFAETRKKPSFEKF